MPLFLKSVNKINTDNDKLKLEKYIIFITIIQMNLKKFRGKRTNLESV